MIFQEKSMKKIISLITVAVIFSSSIYAANYSGGSGEPNNPYQISSAADLIQLSTTSDDWDKNFILTADVNLAGVNFSPIAPDTDKTQAKFQGIPFSGTFDGGNHTISNLKIVDNNDYVGLFGMISETGHVENLALTDVNIIGLSKAAGLCGTNMGTVSLCYISSGKIIGDVNNIGGLCGGNVYGTIQNCYAEGIILGGNAKGMGGLCGSNYYGTILQSYATDIIAISDTNGTGGLVGTNWGGTIQQSYATDVNARGNVYTGGLCGINILGGVIQQSYAAKVFVTGNSTTGAFCGIKGPYGSIENCFWDTQTSNIADSVGNLDPDPDGIVGKTTAEMQTQSTFTNWDFNKPVWMICGQDYPKLIWNTPYMNADNNVSFADFAILAEKWMAKDCGFCGGADLTGDRNVNMYDLNVFAANWLKEEPIAEHIKAIEICYGIVYASPDDSTDTTYDVEVDIYTDNTVERIEILTPAGNTYEITAQPTGWEDETGRFYFHCELDDDGNLQWCYEAEFFNASSLNIFGDGEYTITVYYKNGRSQQTKAWFTVPGTNDPVPQPTHIPTITSFANGATLTSPVTFTWQACTDPNANNIYLGIDHYGTDEELEYDLELIATGLPDTVELSSGNYEIDLSYDADYETINSDGIALYLCKYTESDYNITIE
jgi:hypothetical protein